MPTRAVLFDLDETLVRDSDATADALRATAGRATSRGLDTERLVAEVWVRATDLWVRSTFRDYFESVGVSSGECLWGRFVGEDSRLRPISVWAANYQLDCWATGLRMVGVEDEMLAATLAGRFRVERRARHDWLFPETRATLDALRGRYLLGLVTNGAPDIQRDKLAGSGLEDYFATVQVSGEAGVGKPDPTMLRYALEALGVGPDEAVFVGDSPNRDLVAARRAGVRAIWIRRATQSSRRSRRDYARISSLDELAALL